MIKSQLKDILEQMSDNQNDPDQQDQQNNQDCIEFTKADYFLNPTDPELAYRRRKDEEKKCTSWGQRKLLLTLVQFLTLFWDPSKLKKPKIIYAGAAPGTNIAIVSMLFPEAEFHLYDPAPFKIKSNDKIHLYQQYFTNDDAQKWSGRSDVLFISDIRTADYTKAKNLDENESQIMKDMQMQMDWFYIIDPVQGHLKFRPPYTGGNRPDRINYLYGYIFKQPWAPQTTTESRLVPIRDENGKWITASWSAQKYQDQMFNHNVVIREKYLYTNPFDETPNPINKTPKPIDDPELLNDWDSRAETQIWIDYLVKRSGVSNSLDVLALSRLITKKLTEKSKYKDTLSLLRSKPQFIKHRNFRPSRDNIDHEWMGRMGQGSNNNNPNPLIHEGPIHVNPSIKPLGNPLELMEPGKLASDIGLN